jgi:hypothetical protein
LCALCEGPRDVIARVVLGVDLDICRWCWHKYGPPKQPPRVSVPLSVLAHRLDCAGE